MMNVRWLHVLAAGALIGCGGAAPNAAPNAAGDKAPATAVRAAPKAAEGGVRAVVRVEASRSIVLELSGVPDAKRTLLDTGTACVFVTDGSLPVPPQGKVKDRIDLSWRCRANGGDQHVYHLDVVPGAIVVMRGVQAGDSGPIKWSALRRVEIPADAAVRLLAAFDDDAPVPPAQLKRPSK